MKRRLEFSKSFLRLYGKLPLDLKDRTDEAIEKLISGIEAGRVLPGTGLKRLKGDIWEARADIDLRISFEMTVGSVKFLVVGDHDQIVKFLKNVYWRDL